MESNLGTLSKDIVTVDNTQLMENEASHIGLHTFLGIKIIDNSNVILCSTIKEL